MQGSSQDVYKGCSGHPSTSCLGWTEMTHRVEWRKISGSGSIVGLSSPESVPFLHWGRQLVCDDASDQEHTGSHEPLDRAVCFHFGLWGN